MSTQNKDHSSPLVREGDATSSLSRRNFIGATAVAFGGLLTGGGAALADERAAREAPAAAGPGGPQKRTQVEALASYAARARFGDLSAASREQLPVHILDSLGCCIAALGAGPIQACRDQVSEFGGAGPCTLIGGGKANPVYAAFWNTPRSSVTSISWTTS